MKRAILSILLAAAMSLGLGACGKTADSESVGESAVSVGNESDSGAGTEAAGETAGSASGPVIDSDGGAAEENYDGRLVFDHSMELSYARCFSVDYYMGGYKLASIADGTKMLIIPEGMDVPGDAPEGAIILKQPVTNIMVASAPVTSLINAIGALDAISLTNTDVDSWYIDEVRDAMNDGSLIYAGGLSAPDYEKIAASGTTLAFNNSMLPGDVAAQLGSLGVDVVIDQSTSEEHPLGRMEWIKLYGAIFNLEDRAEEVFDSQAACVDEIARAGNSNKVVAVFYITSDGSLYARNAGDYMAKMVELAGARYALPDVGAGEPGTAKMEYEAFYDKAKDADYIIYVWSMGGKPETLADFLARADILADMKAVKENNVWCTTPDFFQIVDKIGSMVNDIHLMINADEDTDSLTYLRKLQ